MKTFSSRTAQDPAGRVDTAADESMLRTVMRHSAIGMAVLDPDGFFLEVNPSLCQLLGYSRDELTGMNFRDVTYPDDLAADQEQVAKLRTGEGETYEIEKRYTHRNGGVVWARLNVSVIRHANGTPWRFISQILDITASRQEERVASAVFTRLQFLDGIGFYHAAARELAELLDAEVAFIGRVDADRPDLLHMITVIEDGELTPNFSYPLAGTPCAEVVEGFIHIIEDDVQARYPDDSYLVERDMRAYAATPLMSPDGRVFGHLGVLKRSPFTSLASIGPTLGTLGLAVASQMTRDRNRRQYQDLFELAPDALLMVQRDGTVVKANKQAEQLFGLPRLSLHGRDVRSLLPMPGNDPWLAVLESESPRLQGMNNGEIKARRDVGGSIPVALRLRSLDTEDGARLLISIRDIADQIENRRELMMRDQAIDAAGVGMMIVAASRDNLRIVDVNQGFENITGFHRNEVVGASMHAILGTLETSAQVDNIRAAIRHQVPAFEVLKSHRRDGSTFWSEVSIAPVTGNAGDPVRFVGIISDVTERIDTEQKLRIMADALPVLLVYFDRDNVIRMVNRTAENWYALDARRIIGKRITDILPAEVVESYRTRTRDAPADRGIVFSHQVRYPDGKTRMVEVHHVPHLDTDGVVSGHYTMVIDITERERERDQLHHAQRMESIGQLSGGVAHDFNNLLSVIQGNLQLFARRQEVVDDPVGNRWLHAALDAVTRGADLTQRLLAFSRRQRLESTAIDAASHLQEIRPLLQRAVGEQVEVQIEVDDDLPAIVGDLSQFENAILNLAVNARDAMPRGGVIRIGAQRVERQVAEVELATALPAGDYVRIEVKDQGEGMPEEVRSRAFEPFFTTKDSGGGTGLGLASVFGYVRQCGGQAVIHSEPGRGTTVQMVFPESDGAVEVASAQRRDANAAAKVGGETVLVVDDNPEVREAGVELIRSLGYTTLEADCGAAALSVLARNRVDLLFTDVVMPGGINGLELAEQARALYAELPVLFTSGYAEETMQRAGNALPLSAWIHKPIDMDELEARLHRLLEAAASVPGDRD